MGSIKTERELIAIAVALGAGRVRGWSEAESALVAGTAPISRRDVEAVRHQIERGLDPLGDALCAIRTPAERRPQGATYTPPLIVNAMLRWAIKLRRPVGRVVEPGAGSGRFLVGAGRHFTKADLLGIELDPLAALIARGHLAAAGLERRAEVVVADFRSFDPPDCSRATLWIGNPPYVRHHLISPAWKGWLRHEASQQGLDAS